MAGETALRHSEKQEEEIRGFLFRIGARLGLVLFAAVLLLSVSSGVAFGAALLRGLAALLVLAACGWVAEQIVGWGRNAAEPEPEQAPAASPPQAEELAAPAPPPAVPAEDEV